MSDLKDVQRFAATLPDVTEGERNGHQTWAVAGPPGPPAGIWFPVVALDPPRPDRLHGGGRDRQGLVLLPDGDHDLLGRAVERSTRSRDGRHEREHRSGTEET